MDTGFLTKVYRTTHQVFRKLVFGPDDKIRKYTLLILLCFGLVSVCIDLDHFIIYQTNMVRPLHLPVLILVWCLCIGYGAYLSRRFHYVSVGDGDNFG